MDLKESLSSAVGETLGMFGITPSFLGEVEQQGLTSASQVNVLVGITQGGRGNVILGFSRKSALRIVGAMMGGMEVAEIDAIGKSAVAELGNMLVGSAVRRVPATPPLDISPPTVAIGDRLFLMISRIPSVTLNFKLDDGPLVVRYALE